MMYIALLRGINVGGKNIIKMAHLKELFEKMGFKKVQTYIQSGNVFFISKEEEESLRQKIQLGIAETFHLNVPVILRTLDELERMMQQKPFREADMYVSMFAQNLSDKDHQRLSACDTGNDKYAIIGRDVFLLFETSIRNSKLVANIQKSDVPSTIRNSNTINKLIDLGRSLMA